MFNLTESRIINSISSVKDLDAKLFLSEAVYSYIQKKDKEEFLRREAKKIISQIRKDKVLKKDRNIIFLQDCLKDLGKDLSADQFDYILNDYRYERIYN